MYASVIQVKSLSEISLYASSLMVWLLTHNVIFYIASNQLKIIIFLCSMWFFSLLVLSFLVPTSYKIWLIE